MNLDDALDQTRARVGAQCNTCSALDELDDAPRAQVVAAIAGLRKGQGAHLARAIKLMSGVKVDPASVLRHKVNCEPR